MSVDVRAIRFHKTNGMTFLTSTCGTCVVGTGRPLGIPLLGAGFPDLAIYRHFGDFPLGFGSKILNLRLAIKWAIFN
jgi:hypothetical protein